MDKTHDYRKYESWQSAMNLAEAVYRLTMRFPKAELCGLTASLRRTAVLIPAKIASGHASSDAAVFLEFVDGAHCLLLDLQTQIEVARRLDYVNRDQHAVARRQSDQLSRELVALRDHLRDVGNLVFQSAT